MQAAARPIAAPARDIRFDSLRGLLLVSMAINHLPSDLRVITDEGVGIVSSAEGFVFLSGVLAGFVYTRRLWREGASRLRAMTHVVTTVSHRFACLGSRCNLATWALYESAEDRHERRSFFRSRRDRNRD